jgi:glycosyltransferase involved in cell wall biosynthesis
VSAPDRTPAVRAPLLHAVHRFGLPSETFIRDAIAEVGALGWTSWIITERLQAEAGSVPAERIVVPSRPRALDRAAARLAILRGGDPIRERNARKYLAGLRSLPRGLLHAHFGWTAADCVLAARRLSLPFLVSFHGTDLTVVPHDPAWKPAYAGLLERADRATVGSRFLEGRIRELGYAGPVDVIPAGVRLARFPFTGGPRPGHAPRLVYVGRLHAGKGVDVLLDALARVRAGGLPATLRVVGDGELRGPLEDAALRDGLAGAVEFLGARSHDDVRGELGSADIAVVPSRILASGLQEGASVAAKEAQAVGLPLVATRVGGIPESVPPQLRDELVPPADAAALAARIVDLWNDRDRWPSRVALQREWIESEFAWERIARRLSGVYEQLLADRGPPSARG